MELDLNNANYRYKAVIDFIAIEFKTAIPSNAFSIKRKLKLKYVKPLDKSDGAAASVFRAKIYDITSWTQLNTQIENLKKNYILQGEPRIVEVEVSLDAFSKNNSRSELIEHAAYFFWSLSNPVSKNRRFGKKGTGADYIKAKADLIRKITKGGTLYIGNQNDGKTYSKDPISMRIYVKEIDQKKLLALNLHRTRIEITMVDSACPFSTVEEAKKYDFSSLSKYFSFRNFKKNLPALDQLIVDTLPTIAARGRRRRIGGGTREFSRLTTANTKMNKICYDRLRNLTRSLNT